MANWAMFQSVETTPQALKEEVDWKTGVTLDSRLARLAAYSLPARAIRTMRHFALHIYELKPSSCLGIPISVRGSTQVVNRAWYLPELTSAHIISLKSPRVTVAELTSWNQLRGERSASAMLEDVLRDLRAAAEAERTGPCSAGHSESTVHSLGDNKNGSPP